MIPSPGKSSRWVSLPQPSFPAKCGSCGLKNRQDCPVKIHIFSARFGDLGCWFEFVMILEDSTTFWIGDWKIYSCQRFSLPDSWMLYKVVCCVPFEKSVVSPTHRRKIYRRRDGPCFSATFDTSSSKSPQLHLSLRDKTVCIQRTYPYLCHFPFPCFCFQAASFVDTQNKLEKQDTG